MAFDVLLEQHSNHRKSGHNDDHRQYRNENHHSRHEDDKSYYLNYIINRVKNNRKLKIWIGILGIVLLAITIALAIILIPLIAKLVKFISDNGIQGVIDSVGSFLNKIWKGTGK